jgi:hypothetical protein
MISIGIDPGKSGSIAFYDGKHILAIHRNTESAFEIYQNFKRELHDASNIVAACMPCNSKKFTSNWSLI